MAIFYAAKLSVYQMPLNVNGYFLAIDCEDDFAILENSEAFELQSVGCNTSDLIATYLFCRILMAIVVEYCVGNLYISRSIFIHEDNVGRFYIVDTSILDFSRSNCCDKAECCH